MAAPKHQPSVNFTARELTSAEIDSLLGFKEDTPDPGPLSEGINIMDHLQRNENSVVVEAGILLERCKMLLEEYKNVASTEELDRIENVLRALTRGRIFKSL